MVRWKRFFLGLVLIIVGFGFAGVAYDSWDSKPGAVLGLGIVFVGLMCWAAAGAGGD